MGSFTQVDTWRSCPRKRWFKWDRKMRTKPSRAQAMGTALHAAKQRWYECAHDNPSLDEMFPAGWWRIEERDGQKFDLNATEQALIQERFRLQIERGIMVRRRGFQSSEREFKIFMGSRGIGYIAYLDLLEFGPTPDHWRVVDYKSSKKRKYLEDEQSLALNPQIQAYAHLAIDLARTQFGLDLPGIVVAHHQCVWEEEDRGRTLPKEKLVSEVSAIIPKEVAQAEFESEIRDTLLIRADQARFADIDIDSAWQTVPGPTKGDACQAYGGCPYAPICAHVVKPSEWSEQQSPARRPQGLPFSPALALASPLNSAPPMTTPNPFQQQQPPFPGFSGGTPPGGNPFAPPVQAAPQPAPQPAPTPAAPPATDPSTFTFQAGQRYDMAQYAAPWRDPNCQACGGVGHLRGAVCPNCVLVAHQAGRVSNTDFHIEAAQTATGTTFLFVARRDVTIDRNGVEVRAALPQSTPPAAPPFSVPQTPPAFAPPAPAPMPAPFPGVPGSVSTFPIVQTPPPSQTQTVGPAASPAAAVPRVQEAVEDDGDEENGSERGRGGRRRTLVLYLGAMLEGRLGKSDVNSMELLQSVTEQAAPGVDWYAQDARHRWNVLETWARANVAFFGGRHIYSPAKPSADETVLLNALRPFATRVIRAVAL